MSAYRLQMSDQKIWQGSESPGWNHKSLKYILLKVQYFVKKIKIKKGHSGQTDWLTAHIVLCCYYVKLQPLAAVSILALLAMQLVTLIWL